MTVKQRLETLVAQMPDPDGKGMLTENIDHEKMNRAVAAICEGGPENVRALVAMLGSPGSEQDVKPHYALHCVMNDTLVSGDDNARRQYCEVLADELAADHTTYVRSYLCQLLQWAGGREAVAALGRVLSDEALCQPAALALVAIKDGAAEQLRAALPTAASKLVVVHSLAALADVDAKEIFREALGDQDREVRLAGGAGLAAVGDAETVPVLLDAADGEPGWERIQATKHCLVLAERLGAEGNRDAARRIYRHLQRTRSTPQEAYVRQAAEHALAELDTAG
jgi:hypothetical protein